MPAPYNYNIQLANPLAAGLQGATMAQQQQQRRMALQQQQMAMQEAERKKQRQQQYQKDVVTLSENPFSSANDYIKLQSAYPEQSEAIKQMMQNRSEVQLQSDSEQVQKVGSALANKKYDIAKQQLMNYRNALENSGRDNEVHSIDNILQMVDENPNLVAAELNKYLLAQMGPKEFTSYFDKLKTAQMGKPKQKTGAFIVEDPVTKEKKLVTGSYDPMTEEFKIVGEKLPGNLLTKLGETAQGQTERKITEAEEKKRAEIRGKTEEERFATIIDNGLTSAESIPNINRAIELLNSVKTGGLNKAANTAKRIFGIESADEAELNNKLSTAVLQALKPTFGSAFTVEEGARLERISAGFGKSTAGNIRILNQLLKEYRRKANRAILAAKRRGDTETVNEIQSYLKGISGATPSPDMRTSQTEPETPPEEKAKQALTPDQEARKQQILQQLRQGQ